VTRRAVESARHWRDRDVGFDLLSATYVHHRFDLHTHETYVLGVVVGGAARFAWRGATYLSPRGTVMLIEPEVPHTGGAAIDEGWTYRILYPPHELVRAVARQVTGRDGYEPSFAAPVIEDPRLARALVRAYGAVEDDASAFEKESLLVEALGLLVARHSRAEGTRRAPDGSARGRAHLARAIRSHIDARASSRVSLAELAEAAGVSPFHLGRVFKEHFGLPPHAYLKQVRIRRAKELLARGVSPAEVAIDVGFFDQAHMSRHFRRTVGVAPGRFAKERAPCQ